MKKFTAYLTNPATGITSITFNATTFEIRNGYAGFYDEKSMTVAAFSTASFAGFVEESAQPNNMGTVK